jgi:hypothetical protein
VPELLDGSYLLMSFQNSLPTGANFRGFLWQPSTVGSTNPQDYFDRKRIVTETSLSGGISYEAGRRKNINLAQQLAHFLHNKECNVVVSLVSPYKDQRDEFKTKLGNSIQEIQIELPGLSSTQTIIPTRSIEPNVVDEIVGGITLSAGDQIRIYSESPDLIAQVYGVEIA